MSGDNFLNGAITKEQSNYYLSKEVKEKIRDVAVKLNQSESAVVEFVLREYFNLEKQHLKIKTLEGVK